jgi:hypothetical protein
MIGWLRKTPLSGPAGHLLPNGEKNSAADAGYSSSRRGEVARRSRVGEGEFAADHCPLWNDIQRALEGGNK